jgi:DNA-binding GntR family transcriptional regulator
MAQDDGMGGGSATERVVAFIHDQLAKGRLLPGSRIYEGELTEELGVSRSSMRVAMRQLAAMGLVDIVHHRGIYIRRYTKQQLAETQQVREALYGAIARRAAQHAAGDPDGLATLADALAGLEDALEQGRFTAFQRAEDRISEAITVLSGSNLLAQLAARLNSPTLRAMFSSIVDVDRFQSVREELAAVVDAITAGDPDAAEARMRAHVRASSEMFERTPHDYFAEHSGA